MPDTLAARLMARRREAGLSVAELARRSGLTRQYVGGLEAGRKRNPTLATLTALAAALGCRLEDLASTPPV